MRRRTELVAYRIAGPINPPDVGAASPEPVAMSTESTRIVVQADGHFNTIIRIAPITANLSSPAPDHRRGRLEHTSSNCAEASAPSPGLASNAALSAGNQDTRDRAADVRHAADFPRTAA